MKLTIAIPCYNFGAFIGETLDSIINQLQSDVEVLVVDGASTDNTEAVVKSRQLNCPQLRLVQLERKGGIDADMATSVELSEGEYCWLFSADDIMRSGSLERALKWSQEGHDVFLSNHRNCALDMSNPQPYPIFATPGPKVVEFGLESARLLWLRDALNTEAMFSFMSGLMIRREAFLSVPAQEPFMGSCWGHVARLMRVSENGLRVCAVGETWLDKRGENDSFLTSGLVNRVALAIDGFNEIANSYFGENSQSRTEILRILRREQSISGFLEMRLKAASDPKEDLTNLRRIFDILYDHPVIDLQVRSALFYHLPQRLLRPSLLSTRVARYIYQYGRSHLRSTT